MKELNIYDLEIVSGGGWPLLLGAAARVITSTASRNAAIGAGTYAGSAYMRGDEITAPGIAGAMVGGAVGGAIRNATGAGIAGSVSGATTEGLLNGKSPLLDKSGNSYGKDGNGYGN